MVLEVKEDKVDKFLELIPGLFFGSQVSSSFSVCLNDEVSCYVAYVIVVVFRKVLALSTMSC